MKTSNQLKALVRNLSKAANVEAEVILRNFMLERLLERIATSRYRDSFILKGGMLIAAMVGIGARSTMDMDVTVKGHALGESEIANIMAEILSVPIDDGAILTFKGIEEIREEADYPGYRVSIEAILDKTRQILKLDITTGDAVTPRAVGYDFKLMFEDREITLLAYNLETVLAEKFEAIITRSIINTRMRDFYDIYILTAAQSVDTSIFKAALKNTVENRRTTRQMADAEKTIETIASSSDMADMWHRYQKRNDYAASVPWEKTLETLKRLAAYAR